jgi:hypothetical protein
MARLPTRLKATTRTSTSALSPSTRTPFVAESASHALGLPPGYAYARHRNVLVLADTCEPPGS